MDTSNDDGEFEASDDAANDSQMSVIHGSIIVDGRPISDLKVTELRKQLEIRNLSKSGVKKELCERLKNYILAEEENAQQAPAVVAPATHYSAPTEYRSLCEVRPVVKEPSLQLLPTSSDKQPVLESTQQVLAELNESVSETESVSNLAADETFHTANEETRIDESQQFKNIADETHSENVHKNVDLKEDKIIESNIEFFEEENGKKDSETIYAKDENGKENSVENLQEIKEDVAVFKEGSVDLDNEKGKKVEGAQGDAKNQNNDSLNDSSSQSPKNQDLSVDELSTLSPVHFRDNLEADAEEVIKNEIQPDSDDGENYEKEEEQFRGKADDRRPEDELDYEEEVDLESKKKVKKEDQFTSKVSSKFKDHSDSYETKTETLTLEGLIRRREVSPARNKVSQLIHIHNLKRPFTIKALKELLSNFGTVLDDEFWIDGIKTNCIAKFDNEEQAQLARKGLHHVVWPMSSDTSLIVEYSTDEKLSRRRGDEVHSNSSPQIGITVTVDNRTSLSGRRECADFTDKTKLNDTQPKKQLELEDLFKKTVAKPFVYYLPLSDSEAEKRWAKKKRQNGNSTNDSFLVCNGAVPSERRRYLSGSGRRSSGGFSPDRKRERHNSPIRRRR